MLSDLAGRVVAIVGGGPSLASVSPDALAGVRFIAANSASERFRASAAPDDILYFTDNSWSERWPEMIDLWRGRVITTNRNAATRLGIPHIDPVDLTVRTGVLPDHAQASSAHIAACIAANAGARRLLLVGMDCRAVGGETHGIEGYPKCLESLFEDRFLPAWRRLALSFERRGVDVVNCTPGSAIECFRLGSLADEVRNAQDSRLD